MKKGEQSIPKNFIKNHDESWVFICLYIGLAVSLSMFISIFWLIAVAFFHGCIEWASLRMKGLRNGIFNKVLWHLRVDIVLILFALWLGVYIDAIFGILGLGALVRSSAQIGSRALAWQRTIRGVLLTLDDAIQFVKALAMKNGTKASKTHCHTGSKEAIYSDESSISKYDIALISIGGILTASILLAPAMTSMTPYEVIEKLSNDLHPWP